MKSSMYSETTIFSINFDRINGCVLNICVRSFECSSYVNSSGIIFFIKSSRMLLKYCVAAAFLLVQYWQYLHHIANGST